VILLFKTEIIFYAKSMVLFSTSQKKTAVNETTVEKIISSW
jgi:hypothetical protein